MFTKIVIWFTFGKHTISVFYTKHSWCFL